jgi:hypothetical protein
MSLGVAVNPVCVVRLLKLIVLRLGREDLLVLVRCKGNECITRLRIKMYFESLGICGNVKRRDA